MTPHAQQLDPVGDALAVIIGLAIVGISCGLIGYVAGVAA